MVKLATMLLCENVTNISTETTLLADFKSLALKLEQQRVNGGKKDDNAFIGNSDFGETGIFACCGVFALNKGGEWVFRHIGPGENVYILKILLDLKSKFPTISEAEIKIVAGSSSLANVIKGILGGIFHINIPQDNIYIENPKDCLKQGYQEKAIIYRSSDRQFFFSSVMENKIMKL